LVTNVLRQLLRVLIATLVLSAVSNAQISPGKLSNYHKDIEGIKNCTKCHQLGEKEIDPHKCFECHTTLHNLVDAGHGFHASDEVREKGCEKCHSDHHGREYELVFWEGGSENFDHTQTGYMLEGKHSDLNSCRSCHSTAYIKIETGSDESINLERTYLGLDQECLTCHEDEHADQLTNECLDCHTFSQWVPSVGFDHSETSYALTGKHAEVQCEKCHKYEIAPEVHFEGAIIDSRHPEHYAIYSRISFNECNSCHKDIHDGSFGLICSKCHVTDSFQTIISGSFDHTLTGYPLKGKHQNVECISCHKSGDMNVDIPYNNCTDCHDDSHRGQLITSTSGNECSSCHTVDGFVPANYTIETHNKSDFPLSGSHRAIPCFLCHKQIVDDSGELFTKLSFEDTQCQSCHKDVHNGQLDRWINQNGCEFCHTTETWHVTSFDHSLARFKLDGKHREIECLECHTIQKGESIEQVWQKPNEMECYSCHKDIHNAQFNKSNSDKPVTICKDCHASTGWKNLVFEHDKDTQFPLIGGHDNVECSACHKVEYNGDGDSYLRYRPTPLTCAECHGGR